MRTSPVAQRAGAVRGAAGGGGRAAGAAQRLAADGPLPLAGVPSLPRGHPGLQLRGLLRRGVLQPAPRVAEYVKEKDGAAPAPAPAPALVGHIKKNM
jgi:hypothetical protein